MGQSRVSKLIQQAGYKQTDFADLIGMRYTVIRTITQGRRKIWSDEAKRMCRHLMCTEADLQTANGFDIMDWKERQIERGAAPNGGRVTAIDNPPTQRLSEDAIAALYAGRTYGGDTSKPGTRQPVFMPHRGMEISACGSTGHMCVEAAR